jgi:hypothetical protein
MYEHAGDPSEMDLVPGRGTAEEFLSPCSKVVFSPSRDTPRIYPFDR